MGNVNIKNLDISYDNTKVVEQLDLQIDNGEFLVLLGPSGCGKSTLLNAIGGLIDTSGGEIYFDENDVTWLDPKDRGIGMVFQSYALYPTMSVRKNMSFGLRIAGVDKKTIEEKVSWAARLLQLEDFLDRKPSALSGGQRQRVAIGRALVRDADIYLFDEPLSNLDAKLRAELRLEIKKLHKKLNSTMIYVTHDQIEALTLADRIAVMKAGVIQQLDTPNRVYNQPENLFVATFLGSPAMNCIQGEIEYEGEDLFFVSGGLKVSLSSYCFRNKPEHRQAVTLGVRPEHLACQPVNESLSTSSHQGVVELSEPMGSDVLLWTKLASGHQVSHRISSEQKIGINEEVFLFLDTAQCSVFDEASGVRM